MDKDNHEVFFGPIVKRPWSNYIKKKILTSWLDNDNHGVIFDTIVQRPGHERVKKKLYRMN